MHRNTTTTARTPHVPPLSPRFPVYYVLVPFVGLTLIGCLVAMVVYIRRKIRLDDLRHRLIPLYTYDPNEDEENWLGEERDEEDELTEPLYKDGKLSFTSGYKD